MHLRRSRVFRLGLQPLDGAVGMGPHGRLAGPRIVPIPRPQGGPMLRDRLGRRPHHAILKREEHLVQRIQRQSVDGNALARLDRLVDDGGAMPRAQVIGISNWGSRDNLCAGPVGSPAGPCAGRLPRRSRRTPEPAWSVLHLDRGCQGQEWGGSGRTPAASGAGGTTSPITRQGSGQAILAGRGRSRLRKQSRFAERREARVLPPLR